MRALQVVELTGPDGLRILELPEPDVSAGIVVDVHAIGISYPDLLRSQGRYQERAEPPYTLGAELAGVVVHAPADSGYRAGDRVAGSARGAGAERVVSGPESLYRLPADVSFEQGAAIDLNYRTAIVGLEIRGRLRSGETVLVHGAAGGTGTAAIQVARARGCRTLAIVSSAAKADVAHTAGADEVLRSDGPWKDEVLRLTDGRGVNVVWDPVGGDRVLDTMRCLAPEGRWVVIGFVGGPIPEVPLNRVLLRNIDVVGSYIGGYVSTVPDGAARIRQRLDELLEQGAVQPIVGAVHDFEHGADALRDLEERRAIGKVVVRLRD